MSSPQQQKKQESVELYKAQDALRAKTIMANLSDMAGQIINAFPDALRKADPKGQRFMQMICQLRNSPGMYNIAPAEFAIGAVRAASFGLDMDPMLGQLYLVPYGKRLQPIIGYRGLITLAYRSQIIKDIYAEVVFPGEKFLYQLGDSPVLEHVPDIDKDNTKSKPRCVYAIAHTKEEGTIRVVLPAWEVMRRKDRSSAVRNARTKNANMGPDETGKLTPWDTDEFMMWRKSGIRALGSFLPMDKCRELEAAMGLEDKYEAELDGDGPIIDVQPQDTSRKVIMSDFTEEELATYQSDFFPVLKTNMAVFRKTVQDFNGTKEEFVAWMVRAKAAKQENQNQNGVTA